MTQAYIVHPDAVRGDALCEALKVQNIDATLYERGAPLLLAAPREIILYSNATPDIDALHFCRLARSIAYPHLNHAHIIVLGSGLPVECLNETKTAPPSLCSDSLPADTVAMMAAALPAAQRPAYPSEINPEQYRSMVERSPDIIARYDRQYRLRYINGAIQKYGMSPQQFMGKSLHELDMPLELCDFLEREIRTVFESGNTRRTRFTCGEGESGRLFDWQLIPETDEEGVIVFVMGIARDMTEVLRALEARQAQETLFEQMVRQAPYPTIVADKEGTINLIGQSALSLFEAHRPDEVEGVVNLHTHPLIDALGLTEDVAKAYAGQHVESEEIDISALGIVGMGFEGDFSPDVMRVDIFPVRNTAGDILQCVVIFVDITERKQAETQLRQRLAVENALAQMSMSLMLGEQTDFSHILGILGSLFDACRAYIFTFRDDGKYMDNTWEWTAPGVSEQKENLQNMPCAEYNWIISQVLANTPVLIPEVAALDSEARQDRESLQAQQVQSLLIVPLFSKTSGVMGFVGVDDTRKTRRWTEDQVVLLRLTADIIARDLERRHHEAALRESERRFRDILENVNLISLILDVNGHISFCNTFMLDLCGYTLDEVIGRDYFDIFIPPDERKVLRVLFFEGLGTRSFPVHYEYPILTRDGALRLVVWDNTILYDHRGSMAGLASIGRDVTEHRQLEEHYRRVQKMESVGRLAGGVAHDLNNLLAPIIGYCDMLLDELDSETEHHENIRHILNAAERARDLTHQLLAFGRKQVLQLQLININTLVKSLHEVLRRTIPENIEVLTFLTEDIHAVKADRSQVEQVILNLVVNAQSAMPKGGTLTIETANIVLDAEYAATHVGVSPGPHVLLIISDTGVGMNAATLERVFEPFYSTKSDGQGSGLGLATVYGIVKQHGGHIWVYSEPDQGTSFKIYFPTEGLPPETGGDEEATTPTVGGKEAILVVEDNELVRVLAQQVLTKFGYTAYAAESPRQALALLANSDLHIDMLLSDVVMPEMNGKELYQKIIADRPGLKVLYMSGHTENVIAHQGILDTDVPFIPKPFNVRTLLAEIRKVLGGA